MPPMKRSNRLEMPRQLRADEDLGRRIRSLAETNIRSIQEEILWLIRQGLKAEEEGIRQAVSGDVRKDR